MSFAGFGFLREFQQIRLQFGSINCQRHQSLIKITQIAKVLAKVESWFWKGLTNLTRRFWLDWILISPVNRGLNLQLNETKSCGWKKFLNPRFEWKKEGKKFEKVCIIWFYSRGFSLLFQNGSRWSRIGKMLLRSCIITVLVWFARPRANRREAFLFPVDRTPR